MGEYENLKRQEKQNKRMTYLLRMRGSAPVGLSAAGVDGVIAEGNTITVNSDGTNNYGGGAIATGLVLDGRGESDGVTLASDDPFVGTLNNLGTTTWDNEFSHSNGLSIPWRDTVQGFNDIPFVNFTANKDVLISYFIYNPTGTNFPNTSEDGVDGDGYPAGGSVGKFTWVTKNSGTGADNLPDIACPTVGAIANPALDGNESGMHNLIMGSGALQSRHTFGEWNWWCARLGGGSDYALRFRAHNATDGLTQNNSAVADEDAFFGVSIASGDREFNRIYFNSTVRAGTAPVRCFYDDFLLQTGAGCGQLVIIGDAPTLSASNNIAVMQTTEANNLYTKCNVRSGPFTSFSGKYLFTTDNTVTLVNYSGSEGRLIS